MTTLAFIIIDNQLVFRDIKYFGVARSNPGYESNLVRLLEAFRGAPSKPLIIHVQHHSLSPSSPFHPSQQSSAIEPATKPLPGEPVITKNVNSAFIGTNLEELIHEHKIEKLYISGIATDHCVSTTTRMAANLHVTWRKQPDGDVIQGEVILIQDATAAFQKFDSTWDAETVHSVNAESLREFATISTTEEVLRQLSADEAS